MYLLQLHQYIYLKLQAENLETIMARGQQKIQSQKKAQEKKDKQKKSQGHDQKKAAQAGLTFKCSVCMVSDDLI